MKKYLLLIILAIILLPVIFSCAESSVNSFESTDILNTTETKNQVPGDSLPAGLNFKGAVINVLYRGRDDIANYDLIGQQDVGDIVYDAVYSRNRTVEDRLNISFNFTAAPGAWADANAYFKNIVLSGIEDFDLLWTTGNTMVVHGLNDCFYNFNTSNYLDFTAPWWNYNAMVEMSLNGNAINFLYGNLMLIGLRQTGMMYFNKNMYENYFGNPYDLYDLVLNGGWVLDKFIVYSRDMYLDLNGNNNVDEASDQFAFMISKYDEETLIHFIYSTDIETYKRDADGMPVITFNDNRVFEVAERFTKLFDQNNKYICRSSYSYTDANIYEAFASGRTLFLPERYYASTMPYLRGMEYEYGMIPYPKFDETQENYINLIHNSGTTAGVPIAVSEERFQMVTAVLEAMASEQYASVMPAFYEVALKTKYSRDEISSQVIDLVYNCSRKNLLSEYSNLSNGFYYQIATCVRNGTGYASTYDSIINTANNSLKQLYEKLYQVK